MGILKKIRAGRRKTKAELHAAKVKARQEVKDATKKDLQRAKLIAAQEKRLLKAEQKGLKAQRKHEQKMAETTLKQMKEGRINKDNATRLVSAARVVAPVALPLLYQGVTWLKSQCTQRKAARLGVTTDELARHAGHGAGLKARIDGIRTRLAASTRLPNGFVRDVTDRLDELVTATDNAELLSEEQRRRAHRSIKDDLDIVTGEIQTRLRR